MPLNGGGLSGSGGSSGGGGGGSGTVTSVGATNGSIVVTGTPTVAPTIATGTLDAIATAEAPVAAVPLNGQKITNLANGSGAQDAAAFGQIAAATAGLAPLASPALTGAPTAPTQTTGDNSTKIATDQFVTTAVANAVAGVNPAVAVQAATTSAADTSGNTFAGAGIGATMTGPTNTAIVVDGFTFTAIGQRYLVKNDTQSPSGAHNGIYMLTTLQTAITGAIFTRALDYDTPSDMNNTGAIPVQNGTFNATTSWLLTSQVVTVDTTPLVFVQFSFAPSSIVVVTASTYTAASGQFIEANAVSNTIQVTVPVSANAVTWVTKTDASTNTVTVLCSGNVNEVATFVLTAQDQSYCFIGDGTNVRVRDSYTPASAIPISSFGTATGAVNLGGNRIQNVAPTATTDAGTALGSLLGATYLEPTAQFGPSINSATAAYVESNLSSLTCVSGTINQTGSTLTASGSTAGYMVPGQIEITHSAVVYVVHYTGISGSTFTGCTIGSGTLTVSNGDALIAKNFTVSFTPISTAVIVELTAWSGPFTSTSTQCVWGLFTHDTTTQVGYYASASLDVLNTVSHCAVVKIRVTGLSPGTPYQWDWAWAAYPGSSHAYMNVSCLAPSATVVATNSGPAMMRVFAA